MIRALSMSWLALGLVPLEVVGQAPDTANDGFMVDAATVVESVGFQFEGGRTLPLGMLEAATGLKDPRILPKVVRGLQGQGTGRLRVPAQRFDPAEMIRDLERLRRLYHREGFPEASVNYSLRVNRRRNRVEVLYNIDEGEAVRVAHATALDDAGSPLPQGLPDDVVREWPSAAEALASHRGERMSEQALRAMEDRLVSWFGERGYPFASASAVPDEPDSTLRAGVRLNVRPGTRFIIDSIAVLGTERLDRETILAELPFRTGEWVSISRLVEGRREVMGLDMVRLALVDLVPVGESSARVDITVQESPLHLITSELGYESRIGPSLQTSWNHRDFLGGARTLTLQARAGMGRLALVRRPDQLFRLEASLRDPRFFDRRTSLNTGVFGELSEEATSKDRRAGAESVLLFMASPGLTVGFDVSLAQRWIDEYRFGVALSEGIDLFELLTRSADGSLDGFRSHRREGDFGLEAILGNTQTFAARELSWSLRPRVAVSTPGGLSDIQYARIDASAHVSIHTWGNIVLKARGGAGHLFPFGASVPSSEEDRLGKFLELRPVLFTAGGSSDVRGWGASLLGPKFPELILRSEGDSIAFEGGDFSPLGGTNRLMVSVQADVPIPKAPKWLAGLVFLDGGRIWTGDPRFGEEDDDPLGQERFFWAAGAGVAIRSPVGRVEATVGVKLNPTVMDLASSTDVFNALLEGRPLSDVPTSERRRLQLHISVGAGG